MTDPRIAPASPPYSAKVQAKLDELVPAGTTPLWLFRVLARDERLFERSMAAGLLDRGHVSLREREIVILRVCANNRSEYEWGVHVTVFSAKAGLSAEQIAATTAGSDSAACWSPREQLLLQLCDELALTTSASEQLWGALAEAYSAEALLEFLLLIGYYRTISTLTNTLHMPLESWAARFPLPAVS